MIMKRVVYRTPQTRIDLWHIARHIARDNRQAAIRFLNAAEATFKQLAENPELGSLGEFQSPIFRDIRRWRVNRFTNYLIFYRQRHEGIEVIRVLHGARDIDAIFEEGS